MSLLRAGRWLPAALLLLACGPVRAEPAYFLGKSKILAKRGVKLAVGEAEAGRVDIELPGPKLFSSKKFLLGDDGTLHLLLGDASKTDTELRPPCGEGRGEPGVSLEGWALQKAGKCLVALGREAPKLIHWHPAARLASHAEPKCLGKENPGFSRQSLIVRAVTGSNARLFFAEWGSWGAKRQGEDCPINAIARGGLVNGAECRVLAEGELDCNGRSGGTPYLGLPLGLLELKDGKARETWALFEFTQKGSEGLIAVPVLPGRKAKLEEMEIFYYYQGC